MNTIFEKLTHQMTEAVESALSLALHNKNMEVEPVHFLWALLTNSNSVLNQAFNKMSVDKTAIELMLNHLLTNYQNHHQSQKIAFVSHVTLFKLLNVVLER